MRKVIWILTILTVLGLTPMTSPAATPKFDNIYVFGDSYCDVGNIFLLTGGAEPAAPYYNGRFSNGPIWVEHVAGSMGLLMKPAFAGGTDYAFGGAWVTVPQPIGGGAYIPTVPQQVELYLSQHGGKADPHALYILEGGGNDIVGAQGAGSPTELAYQIAVGLVQSEQLLRQAGAKHFVIPNLFNVGLLPVAQPNAAFALAASTATNKYLSELLRAEQDQSEIHILRLDVFNLLSAVQTDPNHFGFINTTGPCLTTTTLCSDPDHTYFWDIYHPTVFGHAFFAVTLENVLSQQDE